MLLFLMLTLMTLTLRLEPPLPNLGTDSYLLRLFKKSLLWKLRKGTPHHWCPSQLVRPISKTYLSPIGLLVSYCHIPFSRPSVVVIQVQV
jgi:hypothetical protein